MTVRVPAELVRHLNRGRCVLFVGSGLSAWAKLPTWKQLLEEMADAVGEQDPDDADQAELKRLLENSKYLEVADHCKEQLSPRHYGALMRRLLSGAEGDVPEPHRLIVSLPFAAVVTTNYDKLIERAYGLAGIVPKTLTPQRTAALGPLLFDDTFFLLKAHGDIDDPESLVLTARDYQALIHANPAFDEIMSAIFLTHAVLFVGYSLNDPDFRLLLDRQLTTFRGHIPDRYALMSGVGPVEEKVLFRTAKLKVLSYPEGKHEQVVDFLQALLEGIQKEPSEAPRAPRRQVRKLADVPVKRPVPVSATTLSISLREQRVAVSLTSEAEDAPTQNQGVGELPDWGELGEWLPYAAMRRNAEAIKLVGQVLARCLPAEIARALCQVPASDVVTLRLDHNLEMLPWEWLWLDDQSLFVRNPVVRAPVQVPDIARGYPLVQDPVRILLIGHVPPRLEEHLKGVSPEIDEIASSYADGAMECKRLVQQEATFDAVARELRMGDYDVIHFAGNAWYDAREAYLELKDQARLKASTFQSLISPRPPAVLVLNSHFTAGIPAGVRVRAEMSGDDIILANAYGWSGFMHAAMAAGVGAFIGCMGEPDDPVAKDVGVWLHKKLLKGKSAAAALHGARRKAMKKHDDQTGQIYVISGYPEIALT